MNEPQQIIPNRLFRHDISVKAVLSVILGTEPQYLRLSIRVLRESVTDAFRSGIAYNNKLFRHAKVLIQQLRMILKKALTSFIKYEKIGAGIIAVIRHNEICRCAATDRIQKLIFHVTDIRAVMIVCEALILTATTWMDPKISKTILIYLIDIRTDIIANLFAITIYS